MHASSFLRLSKPRKRRPLPTNMQTRSRDAHIPHDELRLRRVTTRRQREAPREFFRYRRWFLRARQDGIRALVVSFRRAVTRIS
jgi:hypothetical protein